MKFAFWHIDCGTSLVDVSLGRTNAIGIFENGPGPVFAFNTHLDVVPAGDGWSTDPIRLRRDGGLLYARGACDAKGPLVSMLEAMKQLIRAKDLWSGTLVGVFVADEEVASAGARHFIKDAPKIDYTKSHPVNGETLGHLPHATLADLDAAANAVSVGLASYVFSQDRAEIELFRKGLQFGCVSVNSMVVSNTETRFGGTKDTGFGRIGGWEGLREYLETKFVAGKVAL